MEGRTVSGRRWRGGRRCGGTTTENSIAATKWRMFWESRAGTRTNGVLLGCPSANDGARVPRSHERELAEIGFDIALDWRELRRLLRLLHHHARLTPRPLMVMWLLNALICGLTRAFGRPSASSSVDSARPWNSSPTTPRWKPRRLCRARVRDGTLGGDLVVVSMAPRAGRRRSFLYPKLGGCEPDQKVASSNLVEDREKKNPM